MYGQGKEGGGGVKESAGRTWNTTRYPARICRS